MISIKYSGWGELYTSAWAGIVTINIFQNIGDCQYVPASGNGERGLSMKI